MPILIGRMQGFALFIDEDERFTFGLRRWWQDPIVVFPPQLPVRQVRDRVHLETDGRLRLFVGEELVSKTKATDALPECPALSASLVDTFTPTRP